MRIVSKVVSGILFCSILLVSCGGVTPIPNPTATSTVSPIATQTQTQIPTLPPTATSTQIPATSVFPALATPYQAILDTPTPIALPSLMAADFRLKDWSDQNAIELIRLMGQYAHDSDIGGVFETRPGLDISQEPLKLVIQEALRRFPNSPYRDNLEWHLASPDLILDNQETNDLVLKKIENELNSGQYDLNNINEHLTNYGLIISSLSSNDAQFSKVLNLFGDEREAVLFKLETTVSLGSFAYLVVVARKNDDGIYSLIPLYFFRGSVYLAEPQFVDLTNDGVPEIVFGSEACAGSCSLSRAYIFRWQANRFVEITKGKISSSEFGGNWTLGPQDEKGNIEILDTNQLFDIQDVYKWDGNIYKLYSESDVVPESLYQNMIWFHDALERGETKLLIPKIEEAVASTSFQESSPSWKDYLRFQLAFSYALQGENQKAKEIFQEIVDLPDNQNGMAIPNASRAFLAKFGQPDTIYRSCLAANKVMDNLLIPYRKQDYIHREDYLTAWGYDPSDFSYLPLCDFKAAFHELVKHIDPKDAETIPAILARGGVNVLKADYVDINNDNLKDWIILVDNTFGWALVNEKVDFQSLEMMNWPASVNSIPSSLKITIADLTTNGKPVIIVKGVSGLGAYSLLDLESGPILETYSSLDIIGATNFSIIETGNVPMLKVTSDSKFNPWTTYEWNIEKDDFEIVDEYKADRQLKLESFQNSFNELFSGDRNKTILSFENYVSLPSENCKMDDYDCIQREKELPRIWYLLGLGYELNSQENKAVETYWHLWHGYPESPYALMARYKLEPVKP